MRTSTLQFRFAVAFRHDVMKTELRHVWNQEGMKKTVTP